MFGELDHGGHSAATEVLPYYRSRMFVAVLLLAACPPLPKVPQRAMKQSVDVTARVCAGGATKSSTSRSSDEERKRERRVSIRVVGEAREITFLDVHSYLGLGDASGSATERVVFLEVRGVVVAVDAAVEERSETGPFLYDRLACVIGANGPVCLARTNRAGGGGPGPEVTTCGDEAVKKLPTLAGVQKRLELCPELSAPR